jgi:DNA-binding MarR family transcriptional regulator
VRELLAHEDRLLAGLTQAERATLSALLTRLLDVLPRGW